MRTFRDFISYIEEKSDAQRRAMFAKQIQDYQQQQQSQEKLKSRAKTLKQRQQEREQEFKSKSQQEMQRQAELKAAVEDDARRDAVQSRRDSEAQGQRIDNGLTDAAKATVKATAKGGVKLARAIKNRIRR